MTATLILPAERFAAELVEVEGDDFHHLFRVRRLGTGDGLRVVDGAGAARRAEVARVERDRATLRLGEPLPSGDPQRRVELWVATPRRSRSSWLVEKAVELGVARIVFFRSARAPRRFGSGQLERLRRVARSALEQAGGARLTAVDGTPEFAELVPHLSRFAVRWLPTPGAAARSDPSPGDDAIAVIGPEGGLTGPEQERLEAAGAIPVGLGQRILRIETAAVIAAAMLLVPPSD